MTLQTKKWKKPEITTLKGQYHDIVDQEELLFLCSCWSLRAWRWRLIIRRGGGGNDRRQYGYVIEDKQNSDDTAWWPSNDSDTESNS